MDSIPHFVFPMPELAKKALTQLARLRAENAISELDFESEVERIEREELQNCGLTLHRREHGGGQVTFVIKTAIGDLCSVVGYAAPRADSAE